MIVRASGLGAGSLRLYFWYLFCSDKVVNLGSAESLGVSPLTRRRSLLFCSEVQFAKMLGVFFALSAGFTALGALLRAAAGGASGMVCGKVF